MRYRRTPGLLDPDQATRFEIDRLLRPEDFLDYPEDEIADDGDPASLPYCGPARVPRLPN